MYAGATPTKFGRLHRAEIFTADRLHFHHESATPALKEVEHTVPIPVLDQEDLTAQGIDTSKLVPGAAKVDALGSCTANATTASLAERYAAAGKPLPAGLSETNAVADEEWAIKFYAVCTHQTDDPSEEWPPTDCGSTGLACCQELEKQKLITNYKVPAGVTGALSALQSGTVIQGTPWFNSWMSPDSQGFIDGDGSAESLEAAILSGVAGGHETCQVGIPQLAVSGNSVDLQNTVIKVRNSWSVNWDLAGYFYIHASTLDYLTSYVDYKQFVV